MSTADFPSTEARLLDLIRGFWSTQPLFAAAELGIPDTLIGTACDPTTVAAAVHADVDATARLTRCVAAVLPISLSLSWVSAVCGGRAPPRVISWLWIKSGIEVMGRILGASTGVGRPRLPPQRHQTQRPGATKLAELKRG
jgi:hypothetical protein